MIATLEQACVPRPSVFDPSVRDTVYNIDDLDQIDPRQFFAENYVTQGMRQLLSEAFARLEGKSQSASGAFLLSQSMGGGKTHNLLALGLLAKHPALRQQVMGDFYQPGSLGAVRVVTFSGRRTNTPYGLWGEIAGQLNRHETFREFYAPLRPPGDRDWITLLSGDPILIMLDELPPYFQAAQAIEVGSTTLDVITTTALANLLVAVSSGKLPNACVVLTDLRGSAYGVGSQRISAALQDLEREANRSVHRIDPVRLNSDELYHILRTRLFATLPTQTEIEAVADAYARVIDDARRTDHTTASPQHFRAEIISAYPFHPAIRDLYARFRENPGFQQTRALIRLMRIVVAHLWRSHAARHKYLIGAHDLDLHDSDVISEIRQINGTFDNAIAHDIASEGGTAVAEKIDGPNRTDAQDAAKLILMSSLSQAVNPTLGLDRSSIVAYLAAPNRDLGSLRSALDRLQAEAWYIHATAGGQLLFKNVENLNAKLESYAQGMLTEQQETELRERLREMFQPKTGACYQDLQPLPALDHVQPQQDRITLVVFRPGPGALEQVQRFWEHQPFKNRLLFLSGSEAGYQRVLRRSAYLRAIKAIIAEFQREGVRESDPQFQDALQIQTREESSFYLACRETFQTLYYPTKHGLTELELDPKYVANKYEGENQIVEALTAVYKYRPDATDNVESFRRLIEDKLWLGDVKVAQWAEIKRRAASDPSWIWHHPRALDDLKDVLIRRDVWRDAGSGFVERGPFPKPPATVTVQVLERNPDTGETKLRIKPLHADRVFWAREGAPTPYSPQLDSYDITTRDLSLSFLAHDSTGEHESAGPIVWKNEITLKHRFFQDGDRLMCELRAIPSGDILFTVDGSSPETSGTPYVGPFVVPPGTKFIRAKAQGDGVTSEEARFEVTEGPSGPHIDSRKPAVWKRSFNRDSTGETYTFLDTLERHAASLGGISLVAQRDQRWVDLRTDDRTFQEPARVREQATLLTDILGGGNLTLDVKALRFSRGQDLLDLVADLKTTLKPDEVEQQP